jgi:hypothetical protein
MNTQQQNNPQESQNEEKTQQYSAGHGNTQEQQATNDSQISGYEGGDPSDTGTLQPDLNREGEEEDDSAEEIGGLDDQDLDDEDMTETEETSG